MQDLIDFPVSDDWLEWYHKKGLTPRRPPDRSFDEYAYRLEKLLKHYENRIEILEQNQKMLIKLINKLLGEGNIKKGEKVKNERKINL